MNKYVDTAKEILVKIGGAENVVTVTHCVSRLRFVLKDNKLANQAEIEQIPNVKGVFKPNNQFHIIMGADVPNYFKALVALPGMLKFQNVTKKEVNMAAAQKGAWYQRMMVHFSEIFIPIIPALVAGGLILGFRNIIETDFGSGSPVSHSAFLAGLNDFLWIPAAAVFWYLPVVICWSIFKKMGGSPVLGIIIGLTLLVELPSIYSLTGAAGGNRDLWIFSWITSDQAFKFGSWSYPIKIGYTAQVIPAFLIAFFGVYLERLLNKYVPSVIKQIVVPLVTILVSYSLAMFALGPLGYIVGYGISYVINLALTNHIAKYFFAPIFGLLYAPLVITGLHHALNAVMIQNVAQLGGSFIFPLLALSNICQGAGAIAYTVLKRKDKKIKEVGSSAAVAAWLGISEPAMYGINLKYMFPFIGAILASAVGALLLTIFGVTASGIGNGGILGILSIQAKSPIVGVNTLPGTGFAWFAVASVVSIILSILFTWLLSRIKWFKKYETKMNLAKA